MNDAIKAAIQSYRSVDYYPKWNGYSLKEQGDLLTLADAYLKLTKGEWLDAATEPGWWWHDGVRSPDSMDIVHVFYCDVARCLSYRTPSGLKLAAKGDRWQKVIGPFGG